MAGKLSSALTAVCAAAYVGATVFGVIAALDWALAHALGFGEHAVAIAALTALPFGLLAGAWIVRLAYRAEREMEDTRLIQ